MTLQGCALLNVPPAEGPIGASPIEVTPPATPGYPALRTVPPRPQLSYPVEQRRSIAEGLVSDRENARYTRELVRYRSGQTDLPPPPRPEVPAAEVAERIVVPPEPRAPETPPLVARGDEGAAEARRRTLSEADAELDDASLNDFIRDMVRDTGPAEEALPVLVPPPPSASRPAAAPPLPAAEQQRESARQGFFGWLADLFSDDRAGAAEAPSGPAEEPREPGVPAENVPPAPDASADAPRPGPARAQLEGPMEDAPPADAPRPAPDRAQLERLIEPPPPAPNRSARLSE